MLRGKPGTEIENLGLYNAWAVYKGHDQNSSKTNEILAKKHLFAQVQDDRENPS